ncbi:MAG: pyrroline-5-carboxylate reductase [Gammaproteobacteria bacterium]|nr:pyrroline-5-carboxylate reductase [Gammaproteobacteria bacterium]
MTQSTICFIGAGNMASSLIGGLIDQGYPSAQIIACDIDQDKLKQLQQQFAVRIETDNNQAIRQAQIVVLAVKPQVLQQVCRELQPIANSPLYISIAAGVRATDIDRWLGGNQALVRCMPNTPALVGLGASALFANNLVSADQQQLAEQIMQSTGISVWVDDEAQLDAVTAISGSGPAYFFLFIEALEQAAIELGLAADTAAILARQTALGAATMAIDKDVAGLRQQVTSKGGTTERAIASFQHNQLTQIVLAATQAAQQRSVELAEELST